MIDIFEIIKDYAERKDLGGIRKAIEAYDFLESHDEWIEWNGGECPVSGDTQISIRFRDGGICEATNPASYCWKHDGDGSDIVAYRVSK